MDDQAQFLELQARLQPGGVIQEATARFQRELEALGRLDTAIDERFARIAPGDTEAMRAALLQLLQDLERSVSPRRRLAHSAEKTSSA